MGSSAPQSPPALPALPASPASEPLSCEGLTKEGKKWTGGEEALPVLFIQQAIRLKNSRFHDANIVIAKKSEKRKNVKICLHGQNFSLLTETLLVQCLFQEGSMPPNKKFPRKQDIFRQCAASRPDVVFPLVS